MKKVGFFLKEFIQGVGMAPFETDKSDWAYFEIKGNTEGLMQITLFTADDTVEEPPEKLELSIHECHTLRYLLDMVCSIDHIATEEDQSETRRDTRQRLYRSLRSERP